LTRLTGDKKERGDVSRGKKKKRKGGTATQSGMFSPAGKRKNKKKIAA